MQCKAQLNLKTGDGGRRRRFDCRCRVAKSSLQQAVPSGAETFPAETGSRVVTSDPVAAMLPVAASSQQSRSPAEREMDIPLLIREVHRHPPIWNQKSTHYYNREVVSKSWEEVAQVCGMSYEAVKSKWKHLRDNFRKEFKKCLKESGYQSNPEKYESGWVWFKSLNFLTDKLTSKRPTTEAKVDAESILSSRKPNSQPTTEGSILYPCYEADFENSKNTVQSDESRLYTDSSSSDTALNGLDVRCTLPSSTVSRKRTRLSAGNGANMKKRKSVWRDNPGDQAYDDTYHFLMSLMTPIKHLPYDRQMCVRLKLQEIISSEIVQLHGMSQVPYPVELEAVNSDTSPPTITPNDPPSDDVDCIY